MYVVYWRYILYKFDNKQRDGLSQIYELHKLLLNQ